MPGRGVEPPSANGGQDPKSCVYAISPPGHIAILPVNLTYSHKVVKLPSNMANTATLPPMQTKKETRPNLSQIIGGTFEDIFGIVSGRDTEYTNEGPVTKEEFKDLLKSPEHKPGMPATGSIEFNQRPAVLSQEISQISSVRSRVEALQSKREEVNKKIGIGNTSYQDTVKDDFTLRVDVQMDLDKANSELSTDQLKANREFQIQKAQGKKASAQNAAMEGGTGQTKSGQANISFQAVG